MVNTRVYFSDIKRYIIALCAVNNWSFFIQFLLMEAKHGLLFKLLLKLVKYEGF